MSGVTPIHRGRRSTDTGDSKVRSMNELQLTSSIRIDLERIPQHQRREIIFDLIGLPEHTAVTLVVGSLTHPDPQLIWPLVDALVVTNIFLHIEGTPEASKVWHGTLRREARARADVWVERP